MNDGAPSPGTLDARVTSLQGEVTEFKEDSRRYREKEDKRLEKIEGHVGEIHEYIVAERAARRAVRQLGKWALAIIAAAASLLAIVKGFHPFRH